MPCCYAKRYTFPMKKSLFPVSLILLVLLFSALRPAGPSASQLVAQMLAAGKQVQTAKFTLYKQERIAGKLNTEKSNVKLQQKPLKVYLKYETPNAGMEVLYVQGQNQNQAYIRPANFPWTTLSLDPYSSTMRAGQHHTIHEMGFAQILNITEFMLKKYGSQADNMLKLNGTATWNNLNCYQLTLENPNFRYMDYTVQKGENLFTLAGKFKISEYMILEKNPEIDGYEAVKAGQKIRIPSDYAAKITMLLDQRTNLPVVIKVFDDKGLFELYEYRNLQVNPVFQAAEFTKTYKDYKF